MTLRVLLIAALMLFHGAVRAEPLAGAAPTLIIYLAKGPPNSCGLGCDRWIAVEGNVDQAAASHISRFFVDVKDINRPIYLNSPGGSEWQAFTIGRMLRLRSVVARVGRTIVTACAAGTQTDDACLKVKTSGVEVEAEISTDHAICNSACSYLFFGATTREVAPDATMAVHNGRLSPGRGDASPEMIAALRGRSMVQADLAQASYLAAMGISRELEDLVETVKFENPHALTRPELYRFGIDTRAVAETAWTLESGSRPYVRKIVVAKKGDGASFRTMQWRLFCENKDRARLMFVREFDKDAAAVNSVEIRAGSGKPVAFGKLPERIGAYEVWGGTIASDAMQSMLTASHLQMGEGTSAPDGKASQALFDIDTVGLAPAWTKLSVSCSAAPTHAIETIAPPVTPEARPAAPSPGLTSAHPP
jgi:hypothetical protein